MTQKRSHLFIKVGPLVQNPQTLWTNSLTKTLINPNLGFKIKY